MPIIQTHHITYSDHQDGEWTVELPAHYHKVITIIQRSKTTLERYVLLSNFAHAINHEYNRMRRELDQQQKE